MPVSESATLRVRCKHGMRPEFCSVCSPPPSSVKVPRHSRSPERHVALESAPYASLHYALVRTQNVRPTHESAVKHLTAETQTVHVLGHAFLWVVEAILEHAPNLRVLELIPTEEKELGPRHRELCRARGVAVVAGHYRPEMAWDEDEVHRNPMHMPIRTYLMTLPPTERALLDELLTLGFEEAQLTARYYHLAGEEAITLRELGKEHGIRENHRVSSMVHAVLHYLDPEFDVGDRSEQRCRNMTAKVARLRPLAASAAALASRLKECGVASLPAGLPLSRLDTYLDLVAAQRDGRMASLAETQPKVHRALVVRFGLGGEPVYLTLAATGVLLDGVCRERARQLEEKGLAALGVVDEEPEAPTGE
jgi:hypothetical protein